MSRASFVWTFKTSFKGMNIKLICALFDRNVIKMIYFTVLCEVFVSASFFT